MNRITLAISLRGGAALLLVLGVSSGCDPLPPNHSSEPRVHVYEYGSPIPFGLGGDAHRFMTTGWSEIEPEHTWTNGIGASLILRVPATDKPLTLRMKQWAFVHPPAGLEYQRVEVSVNRRAIATWHVRDKKVYRAVIPNDVIGVPGTVLTGRGASEALEDPRNAVLLIVDLYMPDAQMPVLLGATGDWRRLALACMEMVVEEGADPSAADDNVAVTGPITPEGSPYSYGVPVRFGRGENGGRYKLAGWHDADPEFTWSGDGPAVLGFKVRPTKRSLVVTLNANGNILPPQLTEQPTAVYANKKLIAEWNIGDRDEFTATIPAEILDPEGQLTLEFHARRAISPQALGVNEDQRPLGIAVHELTIYEGK